jgi:hypothetical protein
MEELEEDNVKNVGQFIKKHGIECGLRDVETLDVFTDLPKWQEALEALKARREIFGEKIDEKLLVNHKVWRAKETREELLIPEGIGGYFFPRLPTLVV